MTIDITLRFEDEDQAKALVKDMIDWKETAGRFILTPMNQPVEAQVINIQKVPDSFCTCAWGKGSSYTRGKVFGWYVCPTCNKVSKKVYENFSLLGYGINLLPVELRPSRRGPECNESSPKEWSFLNDSSTSNN